jgi:hypothetical protein
MLAERRPKEEKMTKHNINKIDAARRQIETAITLFFYEMDIISIHTLASAAYTIIFDVAKKNDASVTTCRDMELASVKEEYKKFYVKKMKEAENFFKHADKDPHGVLAFNQNQTEFILWDAVLDFHTNAGEMPPIFRVYYLWFTVTHHELFNFSEEKKRLQLEAHEELKAMGRGAYFEKYLLRMHKLNE